MKAKRFLLLICFLSIFFSFLKEVSALNIIFEGVDAAGKTTTLKALEKVLADNEENFYSVNELEESPLSGVLKDMFHNDPFLLSKKDFDTSVYETLVLFADWRYKQEYFKRYDESINIFDRGFLSILAYQKCILEEAYGPRYVEFYEPLKQLLLFDLKPIVTIVYLSVPIETSIKRIISRGRETPYTSKQIEFLTKVKSCFENELIPEINSMGMDVTVLDGAASPYENAQKIYQKIKGTHHV